MMPPKMFTRYALTCGFGGDDLERFGHFLFGRTAQPTIKEVRGLGTVRALMMSIVAIARAGKTRSPPCSRFHRPERC